MTTHELVRQRDYYYKTQVFIEDKLLFAAISFAAHIISYYLVVYIIGAYIGVFVSSPSWKFVFDLLICMPATLVCPLLILKMLLRRCIGRMYSLADDMGIWYKKAISLIIIGEVLRFVTAFLPFTYTRFGVLTSPFSYMLYSLVYLVPADRYEAVMLAEQTEIIDIIIFTVVYIISFTLYEFILLKITKNGLDRHMTDLKNRCFEHDSTYDSIKGQNLKVKK